MKTYSVVIATKSDAMLPRLSVKWAIPVHAVKLMIQADSKADARRIAATVAVDDLDWDHGDYSIHFA